ncbi:MAG: hypothetical protein HY720_31900 [Planctomycetes bacterium]|nr:hypothetical protein [Planctomycetota bacterium]
MRTSHAVFEHLQLFVPEGDRPSKATPVDLHDKWVVKLLDLCATLFRGATAYGRGVGVWRNDGDTCWDRVTVVEVWIDPEMRQIPYKLRRLRSKLARMAQALRQDVVAYILNGVMYRIPTSERTR